MEPCISLPLEKSLLDDVVAQSKDFANVHGIVMRRRETPLSSDVVCFTPHTLVPSPVPKKLFYQSFDVQNDFHLLMHGISRDYQFLKSVLSSSMQHDEFQKKLFDIYEEVYINNIPCQSIMLGMLRCDYMFDCTGGTDISTDKIQLKQVEVNTIASGLAGLGTQCTRLHRFNLENLGKSEIASSLPESKAVGKMAEGFVEAWKLYGNNKAAILFLIEEVSWNIMDQRWLEYEIRNLDKSIPIIRRLFKDVVERAKIEDNKLIIFNFLYNHIINYLCITYTNMFPLLGYALPVTIATFVLLDGNLSFNGNNLFGEDIKTKLEQIGEDKSRAGYILMDKIEPLVVTNYTVQSEKDVEIRKMVSEIGIFGAIISNGENVPFNSTCGHILRTKTVSSNEGSFAGGSAVIDSPFLV
uniref:Glutathione synthetase n=1 Tax=Saccoglossus kowalevskii TaxID=10224 RepID=A0ABM0LTV3_SACKO|nr:PREDICTED: glutathione synthetase-like [Saccoglossus kowalevskii]